MGQGVAPFSPKPTRLHGQSTQSGVTPMPPSLAAQASHGCCWAAARFGAGVTGYAVGGVDAVAIAATNRSQHTPYRLRHPNRHRPAAGEEGTFINKANPSQAIGHVLWNLLVLSPRHSAQIAWKRLQRWPQPRAFSPAQPASPSTKARSASNPATAPRPSNCDTGTHTTVKSRLSAGQRSLAAAFARMCGHISF